ncbi:MAG: hypothetical protein O2862_04830 [Bacteroidetes bacterium]|nr:hypothetical protein [Bacteroidota bacterium]MDA0898743.1 hypothetical protein [Bacteroidota bacterium]
MSEDKLTARQGFAIGGGLMLGTGFGFLMIPYLGGTALVGGIMAGLGVGLLIAAFMKNYL